MKRIIFLLSFLFLLGFNLSSASIDESVDRLLMQKGIQPSPQCSDEVFLRRLFVVMTGMPPSVEQVEAFLSDRSPKKRSEWIDRVLDSQGYEDYMVLKWGDLLRIKSEFPSNLWPNAVQGYNRWLRERVRANVPYDRFVSQLLLSTGSNFRYPEVNFYRGFRKRSPKAFADNMSLLFLGERKAFDHVEAFFRQIKFKGSDEWKEEFILLDRDLEPIRSEVRMPDGKVLRLEKGSDMRKPFVDWLASADNDRFVQVFANRAWSWAMGCGLIDPVEDFRSDNFPSNPELLDLLSNEFKRSGLDIKSLFRLILNSEIFQRSSRTNDSNRSDNRLGSHFVVRRANAETIVDQLVEATGGVDKYMSRVPEPYSYFPEETRAMTIGDGTVTLSSLELFGRPTRDVSFENDRKLEVTAGQELYLLNSSDIFNKIKTSPRLSEMVQSAPSLVALTDRLYLTVLSRFPTDRERTIVAEYRKKVKDNRQLANDLLWALFNSREFIFIN